MEKLSPTNIYRRQNQRLVPIVVWCRKNSIKKIQPIQRVSVCKILKASHLQSLGVGKIPKKEVYLQSISVSKIIKTSTYK